MLGLADLSALGDLADLPPAAGFSASAWLDGLRKRRVDAVFHNIARLEDDDLPRRDRHDLPCLGIPAHPLRFLAQAEGAERRKLDGFPTFKSVNYLLQHGLDKFSSLVSRQTDFFEDRFRQISPRCVFPLSAMVRYPSPQSKSDR